MFPAKALAWPLTLTLLLALPAAADFVAGLDAFDHGDYAAALKQWQPIAERGDANAEYNLGLLYALGKGVPQNYQTAAEWYRKAAEQGVAAAEYNLGVLYANGQGVSKSPGDAINWFTKAAQQGIAEADASLGDLYHDGSPPNYANAEEWYRKAAAQGIASAQFSLGLMHDLGEGVPQDYDEAIRWYRQAADAGYAPALTNLGILYYNQQGVKRDLLEAYAWLERAQKLNDPRAGELLRATAKRMTPKQIRQAQARADEWQAPSKPAPLVQQAALFKEPQTAPAGVAPASSADRAANPPVADVWTGVDRIVAVGDVHGDYEQFVQVLQSAGLIDGNANWTGGKAHLVQTGDIVDRGPDSRAVMDLLMKLEKQAQAAGGAVHCLLGNHEAMDLYGDLRFVSPAEFAAFRGEAGGGQPQYSYQQLRKTMTAEAKPELNRAVWNPGEQPGLTEFREAFSPTGRYGKWLRSHNAIIKIDRTLFVHGGLSAKYANLSLEQINEKVRQELEDPARLQGGIVMDQDGPLWNTALAKGDEAQLAPLVDRLLQHFGVDRIVIGHSYSDAAVTPRFGGKVVLIDVGLSRIYDDKGKLACLEIDRGHAYALHRGHGLELPKDENGPDMLRYLKQAAALDPQPSPLEERIEKLEASQAAK
ncbi:MAG TPA: metallophosphoesterase [Bryobacteraceae bacterium]|nr:metallophosphoesterase [Bryobacteraceae bacterium]